MLNFYEGLTTNAGNTDGAYFARCVRAPGGAGAATYAIDGGEVHDLHTGLIWQQTGSTQTMSASAARSYCATLALGGHPWRLPSIKELATTVDESRVAPAINRTAFPNTGEVDLLLVVVDREARSAEPMGPQLRRRLHQLRQPDGGVRALRALTSVPNRFGVLHQVCVVSPSKPVTRYAVVTARPCDYARTPAPVGGPSMRPVPDSSDIAAAVQHGPLR